ncbi:MAG: AmmeMemoRadiSam system protein A [Mariprofundaceae bacterium]|nr:AmmeMemoRadiSam system protein A [Mariprofundaceae bacterium]
MPENAANGQGPVLLAIARQAIAERLGLTKPTASPDAPYLQDQRACFVTLHKQGALRGCIGTLLAHRPLGEDVRANACAAAFSDPRFPPLTAEELPAVQIEVSVLSLPEAIYPNDEADLMAMLRPGVDGLILEYGAHRSTFLPQVWQQLPTPEEFLAQLRLKAGLLGDFWSPELKLSHYTVEAFNEQESA